MVLAGLVITNGRNAFMLFCDGLNDSNSKWCRCFEGTYTWQPLRSM